MRYTLAPFLFAVTLLIKADPGPKAHPHAWIDLNSTLVLSETGQVTALRHQWLFGDFYSSYVISDLVAANTDILDGLRATARENLLSLAEYNYFTKLVIDGKPSAFNPVQTFETGVINDRIYLNFTVEISESADPATQVIRYAVFDPTYYIEILHAEGTQPEIDNASDLDCRTDLITPEPTFEELAYAASLDATQSGGDGLGEQFAEWVTLQCR